MLHILWIIFMVLLWIILGIISLLLLILLVLLLSPIKYRLRYKKNIGDFKTSIGDLKITYLFSFVKIQVILKDLTLKMWGKIFYKKLKPSVLYKFEEHKENSGNTVNDVIDNNKDLFSEIGQEIINKNDNIKNSQKKYISNNEVNEEPQEEILTDEDLIPKEETLQKEKHRNKVYKKFYNGTKIFMLPNKIFIIVRNFVRSVRELLKKRKNLKELYFSKETRYEIRCLFRWLKKIWKHIKPNNYGGKIKFDLEDPSYVGYILALYGITYGKHKGKISLISEVEFKNELYVNIKLEGKIIPLVLVIYGARMYINKDLRHLYKKVKNRED